MKKLFYVLTAIAFTACAANKPAADCTAAQEMSVDSTQSFATALFAEALNEAAEENFCLSPVSAQWALAMAANGARGNTAEQIYSTLGYPAQAGSRTSFNCLQQQNIEALNACTKGKISVANSIWANNKITLKEEFIKENELYYGATVRNSTFDTEAIKEINSWCSKKTEGRITSILNKAQPSMQLLLINALYFKAQWLHPFEKRGTANALFTKADGGKTTVQMMRQSRIAPYYEDSIMQATARPFEGGDFSMILILPQKRSNTRDAFARFAEIYNHKFLADRNCTLQLSMPKFKCEFGTSLKPMMQRMGITDAFGEKADFGRVSKTPLLIDDIIQKTYIAVDEVGAEAAAVTAVMMVGMSARPMEKKVMTLDRPFIYAITNNLTGEILFIGKVGNPES